VIRSDRVAAGLGALLFIAVMAHALAAPEVAERRFYLALLAASSLVWFTRAGSLASLAALVPLGPVVDFFFLTPGRGVYATEVVLMSALGGWLTSRAFGRDTTPWPRPSLPVLLFCNFGAVGLLALVAGHADRFVFFTAYRMARVLLLSAAVGYMFHTLARDPRARARAVRVWTKASLAALGLLGLFGIVEYLVSGRGGGHFEPGSFYRSSVGLAVHVAFFAPLALSIWLGASARIWRLAGAASWLLAVACLPLTASRGALGSLFATSVLVVLVTARRTRGRGWRGIAVVLLLLAAGLSLLAARPELAGEAFAYKYRASIEGDFFSTRVEEWGEAWRAIGADPLFGEGPEAWAPSVPLELARRHGVPAALLALAAIVVAAWITARRAWRRDREPSPVLDRGLHDASVAWGVALGLVGLFLVGLAETGLGARSTPLLAVTLSVAGMVCVGRPGADPTQGSTNTNSL